MTDFKIIQLTPEQWPLYRQIRLEALQNAPAAFVTTYADMVHRPDSFWQGRLASSAEGKDTWLLFAQAGERIVGIIGAYLPETSGPGPEKPGTAMIVSVYVAPDYRGTGAAGALMEGILQILRDRGIARAGLTVNRSQAAALALYRRFGFPVTGEQEEVAGDGLMHSGYVMEMQLTP